MNFIITFWCCSFEFITHHWHSNSTINTQINQQRMAKNLQLQHRQRTLSSEAAAAAPSVPSSSLKSFKFSAIAAVETPRCRCCSPPTLLLSFEALRMRPTTQTTEGIEFLLASTEASWAPLLGTLGRAKGAHRGAERATKGLLGSAEAEAAETGMRCETTARRDEAIDRENWCNRGKGSHPPCCRPRLAITPERRPPSTACHHGRHVTCFVGPRVTFSPTWSFVVYVNPKRSLQVTRTLHLFAWSHIKTLYMHVFLCGWWDCLLWASYAPPQYDCCRYFKVICMYLMDTSKEGLIF